MLDVIVLIWKYTEIVLSLLGFLICVTWLFVFFFQAEDGIRDAQESRGLGDVYKRQGVYGSFNCILFDHYTPPIPTVLDLAEPVRQSELVPSRVFGPTCDGLDTIFESVQLPLLSVGQLLLFKHMGAYTNAAASNFNGVSSPNVIYFRSLGH
eukprot:TRINITY_DN13827_c0_g1_i4.p1 TRINITY_DN13827_c0_g1~~TRINITY_DN13827_c0_g1_i4.p1  ORF type:complete len:152 (+),score=16.79 TRINITY_DN13827_c0_g1_i4:22-477(+)